MEKKISNNSIHDYTIYWKSKFEKEKKNLEKRKKKLLELAKFCSNFLKKEYNVDKVYLIGSLARDYKIHYKSDIDLVVVGLPDKKYFSALNKLYKLVPKGVNIDLITKETASEFMKRIIEKEGVLI